MHRELLIFLLAAIPLNATAGVPQLQPSVETESSSMKIPPGIIEEFSYVYLHTHRLADADHDEYRRQWDRLGDAALDCDDPDERNAYFSLAALASRNPVATEHIAERLESLAINHPECFLDGVQNIQISTQQRNFLETFYFTPEHESPEVLDTIVMPVLAQPAYATLQSRFDSIREQLSRQAAARAERERHKQRYQQSQAFEQLLLPDWLESNPDAYWERWRELAAIFRSCEDREFAGIFLGAAVSQRDNAAARQRYAEVIENLAMSDTVCLMETVSENDRERQVVDTYLMNPLHHEPESLYAHVMRVPEDERDGSAWSHYWHAMTKHRYELAEPVRPADEFLWSVKEVYILENGRVFVPAGFIKHPGDFDAQLAAAWESDALEEFDDGWKHNVRPVRIFPRNALDFITQGRFGTYYLLNFTPDGLDMIKARVKHAAISHWSCSGEERVPMLELEPERPLHWVKRSGMWFAEMAQAIEIRDDLPAPSLRMNAWPDNRYFFHGILSWPQAGSDYRIEFTDGYVDTHFVIEELASRNTFRMREMWDSCH